MLRVQVLQLFLLFEMFIARFLNFCQSISDLDLESESGFQMWIRMTSKIQLGLTMFKDTSLIKFSGRSYLFFGDMNQIVEKCSVSPCCKNSSKKILDLDQILMSSKT